MLKNEHWYQIMVCDYSFVNICDFCAEI